MSIQFEGKNFESQDVITEYRQAQAVNKGEVWLAENTQAHRWWPNEGEQAAQGTKKQAQHEGPEAETGCEDDPRLAFVKSRPLRIVIVGGSAPNSEGVWTQGFAVVRALMEGLIDEGHPLELIEDIFTNTDFAIGNPVRARCSWAKDTQARDTAVRKFVEDSYRKLIAARNQHKVAEAELTAVTAQVPEFINAGIFRETDLPKRDWLFTDHFELGYLGQIAGHPGSTKSSLALRLATQAAAGISIPPFKFGQAKPVNVLVINAEDDVIEQARREIALLKTADFQGVKLDLLDGRLHFLKADSFTLIERDEKSGHVETTEAYKWLVAQIVARDAKLVIIDPLIEVASGVDENKASEHHEVLKRLREIARALNVVVIVVHHFSKGANAGDQHASRGSSTTGGSVRLTLNCEKLSEEQAAKYGIAEQDRHFYVRTTVVKANNAMTGQQELFCIDVQTLSNGDRVAALSHVNPAEISGEVTQEIIGEFFDEIENPQSLKAGEHYSPAIQAARDKRPDGWLAKRASIPEASARAKIEAWIGLGYLRVESYRSPRSRRDAKGLFVARRPEPGDLPL